MASGSEIVDQMRRERGQTTQAEGIAVRNSLQYQYVEQAQQAQYLAGLNVLITQVASLNDTVAEPQQQATPEIPVTEEMIAAARQADWACQIALNDPGEPDYFVETCSSIYRAMRAKAPWPIPTDPSDEWRAICNHAAALVRERDEALELLRSEKNARDNAEGRVKELEARPPLWGYDPGSGEVWITGDNTIGPPQAELTAAVARAEAAEKALVAYQTVEKRTAEREASIHNAIRRGR